MRKWLALAAVALPLVIIVTLPASLVIPRFDPPSALGQYSGSVWSGSARWRQDGQAPMRLHWRWTGGRDWVWVAEDAASRLSGRWRPGASLKLSRIEGRVAIDRLDLAAWLVVSRPQGYLRLAIDRAVLVENEIPQVDGVVIWEQAALQGAVSESLGRVELDFEPGADALLARVRSLDPAAVTVRGTIEMDARDYRVDLWLRASPERPDLAAQLGSLGERQSDGQVRLRLSGALGLAGQMAHTPALAWASLANPPKPSNLTGAP